jgi:hypothetical protein
LRVHELKEVIRKAEQKIKAKPEKFDKALKALIKVNEHFDDVQKQMQFLKQAKKALMNEALK